MLGNRLRQLRINHNYTQRDLGKLLNISHVAYGDYERGKSFPDLEIIKKLCTLYRVNIDYLLNNELNDVIVIPKEEFEKLKNSLENINKIINNVDKTIFNNNPNQNIKNINGKINNNITISHNNGNIKF